jgi:hypothetical protein
MQTNTHNPSPPISDRSKLVLATLALQGPEAELTPVQVQKLFFLLDREISALTKGPHFQFSPYDYGPFDPSVYREIENLEAHSLALTAPSGSHRTYSLTSAGMNAGLELAKELPQEATDYIKSAGEFVRRLSFNKLVSSIYKEFPEMRANSIFRE